MTTQKTSKKGIKLGPRPEQWKSGPDQTDHDSYYAWLQCRNQARYRKEPWTLSFEQWLEHWSGLWHRRGRTSEGLCITRRDGEGAWSTDNVIIITRRQHAQRKTGVRLSLGEGPNSRVIPRSWAAKP